MSRRDNASNRCAGCALHEQHCLCNELPQLHPRSHLCLVVHYREARKPTNTGQLAARCLAGSQVIVHGEKGRATATPAPALHLGPNSVLLFPEDGAELLSTKHLAQGPLRLIVPDGNWRQAAKMARRVAWMAKLPRVALPPGPVSTYRLRQEPKVGGLATMEAIARAFGILEGPTVQSQLEAIFEIMVERTLACRQMPATGADLRTQRSKS